VVVRVEGLGFFRVQERARHQLEELCRSLEGEGVVRGWEVYLELDPPAGRATPHRGRPDGPRAGVPLRTERRTP
jgi:hypothetical protein